MLVSKIIKPFRLLTPLVASSPFSDECPIQWTPSSEGQVSALPSYTALIQEDGSPWTHGNLYLMQEAFYREQVLDYKTIRCKSQHLMRAMNILCSKGVNYLTDTNRQIDKPTYVVRKEIIKQLREGSIVLVTAEETMRTLVEFYTMLIESGLAQFRYGLWLKKKSRQHNVDRIGRKLTREFESTDLTDGMRKAATQGQFYRENGTGETITIQGKRLTPLTSADQTLLIKVLAIKASPPIRLACLFSLCSAARAETTFTLREKHFSKTNIGNEEFTYILAGGTSGIDIKGDQIQKLKVPGYLYNEIRSYIASQDRKKRSEITDLGVNGDDQYVFLTARGTPYYTGSSEQLLHLHEGSTLRQYISAVLLPELKLRGFDRRFGFHDLRATCGMNLIAQGIERIKAGASPDSIIADVLDRMGHAWFETTMEYLHGPTQRKLAYAAQEQWEIGLLDAYKNYSTKDEY